MLKHPRGRIWIEWLDRILDELLASEIDQRVFERWRGVVVANKAIDQGNRLVGLICGSYMERQALTIRRQLDRNSAAISIAKLMEDVAKHAPEITRVDFLNGYTSPQFTETWEQGERFFDQFADPAAPHVVSASLIRGHVEELRKAAATFVALADQWLAHSDRGREWPAFTWDDLNACLSLFYRRWEQYRELVNCSPVVADVPELTGTEWEAILDIPWRSAGSGGEVQ
jgi:hypothetical protein